ncbi:MAG: response regulator [Candidatus Omnitrophica bacterium]|nr:response regulator [Candidatus Omnitrophota bacterium]
MDTTRILVIDDEASITRLLSKVLIEEGYGVLTAANAQEALKVVESQAINLVFIDLCMPGLNGIEAIKEIKKKNDKIRFVIITAFGDMASVKEATELGVFDYITKPFDLEYIRHLVRHIQVSQSKALPYQEYMGRVFSGELTPEEAKQKKFSSFKQEVQEKLKNFQDMDNCVDKNVCTYYHSGSFTENLKEEFKKITKNFYFIIITSGVVIGILFGYIYAKISNRNLYNEYSQGKRITIVDFYRTLNDLKYWMQKHTEQGILLEKDTKFKEAE